ncbi:MAG: protein translocase subunit SecF [Candidatus Shapirobacteria bacterium]
MNIMKYRPLFYFISITLIVASIFSIIFWGFKYSIDFSGGSSWQFTLPSQPDKSQLEEIFQKQKIPLHSISQNNDQYTLKFDNIDTNQKNNLVEAVTKIDSEYSESNFETLGPLLGRELLKKTIYALILSAAFLLIFIATRFNDASFGISAILAMLHDTIILLGTFSALGHFFGAEIDALFVTALLTTLSSSTHDTVVTFDRIRELKSHQTKIDWKQLANRAVSEVIVRSINNSMTIIFMLLALVFLGADSTRWFSTALLIGVICGTYSSVGVAIPLMLLSKKNKK